jgi:hypothetical protein
MSDLAAALREAGHGDVADALERKELAGRLRQSGRDDLADQLEADQQTPTPAPPERPLTHAEQEQQFAEQYRDALNRSLSPTHEIGGFGDGRA